SVCVVSRDSCRALCLCFFFSSRRRHTRCLSDWSSDVCSSDLRLAVVRVDERLVRPELNVQLDHAREVPERVHLHEREVRQQRLRSEERRVGKEWRSRWAAARESIKHMATCRARASSYTMRTSP